VAPLRDRLQRRVVVAVGSRVVVPDRDLRVLRFAAEMFGVPMTLAAELVARDPASAALRGQNAATVARRTAARLEAGRLARRLTVNGQAWLVPTGPGLWLAMPEGQEQPYDVWHPVGWKLEHVAATARLRLALTDRYPAARWESERAIRRRWQGTGARVRKCDGGLRWPDGTATGIEVELHIKQPHLYQALVADRDLDWDAGVWWFCPAGQVDLLARRLAEAGGYDHKVDPLPFEVRS
jgi:hypothetical protein